MSALNCRPGDLAVAVKGLSAGSMFTCIEPISAPSGATADIAPDEFPVWRLDKNARWCVQVGRLTKFEGLPYYPDRDLIPIRPLADPEDVTTEREVTA